MQTYAAYYDVIAFYRKNGFIPVDMLYMRKVIDKNKGILKNRVK